MSDEHDQPEDPIAARDALIEAHADSISAAFIRDTDGLQDGEALTDRAVLMLDTRDALARWVLSHLKEDGSGRRYLDAQGTTVTRLATLAPIAPEMVFAPAGRADVVRMLEAAEEHDAAEQLTDIQTAALVFVSLGGVTVRGYFVRPVAEA
jgi:hypothetical protein